MRRTVQLQVDQLQVDYFDLSHLNQLMVLSQLQFKANLIS